jgi:hypothetical protein
MTQETQETYRKFAKIFRQVKLEGRPKETQGSPRK